MLLIKLKLRLREYLVIGGCQKPKLGMPPKNIFEVQQIHESIVGTYQDDFSNIQKVDPLILRRLFRRFQRELKRQNQVHKILEGENANVKALGGSSKQNRDPAFHSDANRSPLHAEINESVYKCFSGCGIDEPSLWRQSHRINEMSVFCSSTRSHRRTIYRTTIANPEDPYRSPQFTIGCV